MYKNYFHLVFIFIAVMHIIGCSKDKPGNSPAPQPPVVSDTIKNAAVINGNKATLRFDKVSETYRIYISLNNTAVVYEQPKPLVAEIVKSDNSVAWQDNYYTAVTINGSQVTATGSIKTDGGTTINFTDVYQYTGGDVFEVNRTAVIAVPGSDKGFATRLAFQKNAGSSLFDYDFFVPSVWYKQNLDVPGNALASSMMDDFFWFREDRLPLPLFMLRDKINGATFSVYHKDAEGTTFYGEDGLNRIIDGRMKFAAVGMQNNTKPLIGLTYPGSEGERTGIYGMAAQRGRWAYRSHPVSANYMQQYKMAFSLTTEPDYVTAMKNTWNKYFSLAAPANYNCDLNTVYNDQVNILNRYWKVVNNAPGFPFRVTLNGNVTNADYNYNMGFVGMEIPNAALLIREGLKSGNTELLTRGEQVAAWWATNTFAANGAVRTWYDPATSSWRSTYPTYARVLGDGMLGLLWAWNYEKKYNRDNAAWLTACKNAANWIITKQGVDGSFPRSINYVTNTVQDAEKTNTSHVIPFLAELFFATGDATYKNSATAAGEYIYQDVHQQFKYIGGTPDNPNVPDKEAASMAMRAFLALYDITKNSKWLDAAGQAAQYYQTWVYGWNVPIPGGDPLSVYPQNRGTTGLSVIATANNAVDTYAAIDAFNFYRMYLYQNDGQFLKTARLLLRNTKQAVNWDRSSPIPGYGDPGIMNEALTLVVPRGRGVGYYLPWQSYNFLEPMVLFKDVFGNMDIDVIDNMDNKTSLMDTYSVKRNY